MSEAASVADIFYNSLGHHVEDDISGDLQKLTEGLSLPLQAMYDLVRPRVDQDGWAILLDPDECPAYALLWPAQVVGVRLTPGMSEEQQRNEIREPTGWKRGQPESIRIATRQTLLPVAEGEELRVIIRPRTPEVGIHQVRTWLSQTPEPARTEAVLRRSLPAWEVLEYLAVTGMTYADVKAEEPTYAAVKADFTSYKDLVESLP